MLCQGLSTVHGCFRVIFASPPSRATAGLRCCWQGRVLQCGLQPGQWGGDGVWGMSPEPGDTCHPAGLRSPGNFRAAPHRRDGREKRAAETAPGCCQRGWEVPGAELGFGRGPFAGAFGCQKRLRAAGPVLKIPVRDFIPPAGLHLCGTWLLLRGQCRCCRLGH